MDDLIPITRTERLLDGEDLTPTNREEMFIKRIYDKTQEIPEPVNRKEYFLKKAGEAGGDITVESLSVTANGIYSEEGKAYSPVTVEVEPPENSYQLKSITTPTSLATFEASEMPMPKLKVSVEAKQDLHGYDKPWPAGGGKNKCDNSTNIAGYYNDQGVYSSSNDYRTSALIEVKPNTEYVASVFDSTFQRVAGLVYTEWDANENFISQTSGTSVITTNSNTKYLRVRNYNAQTALVKTDNYFYQLEEGNQATSYAPYSNVCPISGWDNAIVTDVGINLFDGTIEKGYINNSGIFVPSGFYSTTDYIAVKSNTSLYFKVDVSSQDTANIAWYDKDKGFLRVASSYARTNSEFVVANDAYYMRLITTDATTNASTISINYPSTDTSYHAYNGNTYTVSWQTEAGIVYFGYIDFIRGELVGTHKGENQGDKTWYYKDSGSQLAPYFWAYINDAKYKGATATTNYNLMCTQYKSTERSVSAFVNGCITFDSDASSVVQVQIKDDRYNDATTFKTAMDGVVLVYELATPITYQLTPTLIKSLNGQNNLSVDCGEIIEGEYFKALGGE